MYLVSPLKAPLQYRNSDILTDSPKNSSTLRRLAADHSSLHVTGLPPNYLFPPPDAASNPDDLTQLTVLLTGSQGTPYSQGLWQLHLKIPNDYPKSPPKAAFKTRIWHPNVEESTGSVCVDTLKKDWESKLTLRDILIVSSSRQFHYTWLKLIFILRLDDLVSTHSSKPRLGLELRCWPNTTRRLRSLLQTSQAYDFNPRSNTRGNESGRHRGKEKGR
jgi:ubiquitin-protein ligase